MVNYLQNITKFTTKMADDLVARSRSVFHPPPSRSKSWWVRIHTEVPAYTYYFGPFDTRTEAILAQFGYIQDLEQENAQNIQVAIAQFSPQQLTICEDGLNLWSGLGR